MKHKKIISISVPLLLFALLSFSQQQRRFNLSELAGQKKLQPVHRSIEVLEDGRYQGVRMSQDAGEGLVWIEGVNFAGGVIQFDARGKDEYQKSFVGVAFYGQSDSTFDAVYFRPFNFHAKDSVRHIHAVQYISHPIYTWKKLREERNGQFEKTVVNAPDPNDWFHVKVIVKDRLIKVFINDRKEPELTVQQLSNFSNGKIGLFAGDGSGGDFANLILD